MTGRGLGYCAGYPTPGYMHPAGRRLGMGFGRGPWAGGFGGWGRGYRHGYYATGLPGWARAGYGPAYGPVPAPPTAEQEAASLEAEAEWLRGELNAIEGRLSELRAKGEEERGG